MSLLRNWLLPVLIVLLPLPGLADTLQVDDAWVRAGPPTAEVLAAYLRLRNTGDSARKIVAAESPAFERVEMHRTVIEDGMARMLPQSSLTVPAGGELVLEPGGYHLMLIQPNAPLKNDDKVELTLTDADDNRLSFTAVVRPPQAMDENDHQHHMH